MPVSGNGDLLTPDACKRKLAVFDGRQRADIDLVFKRMDRVHADKGYQGPVVVCTVLYTPIASWSCFLVTPFRMTPPSAKLLDVL